MSDRELIAGLESAVNAAPGNVPLRLHLIEHMVGAGRAAEGLAHAEAILRAQPDNVRALALAAQAAETANDVRADAFRRVAAAVRALTDHADPAPAIAPPAAEPSAGAANVGAPERTPAGPALPKDPPAGSDSTPAPTASTDEPPAPAPEPVAEEPAAEERDEAEVDPGAEEPEAEAPREFSVDPQSIQWPTISLRNVIGVTDVKQRIQSVVLDPLQGRASNGGGGGGQAVSSRGGYLMFGPPGCGKGFFARVVAGEMGAAFLPIKLKGSLEWPGDPRQNIQRIFEAARDAAPCVLFLDDVDLAGRHPDAPDDPVDRGVVARLVTELDTAAANRGVFVFAGAVSPWDVDMSLRAEGRLDRTLLVLPPDEAAREAILRFHLKNTRLAGVDVGWIVQRTQHFSGDDLLLLCDTAAGLAAAEAPGGEPVIGPGHVARALRDVRPTAPAWFSSVMEQAVTSNHGGIYDEVLAYIDEHQLV